MMMKSKIPHLYPALNDDHPLSALLATNGLTARVSSHSVDIYQDKRIIRISLQHFAYAEDIINSFDYYFSAVVPLYFDNHEIVDYSSPRYHEVIGFDLMPVLFSSFCEPLMTTKQYLDFANLSLGSTVLDLGAYSGLTSMMFKDIVGNSGKVIAVEADSQNLTTIEKNFDLYKKVSGNHIDVVFGAVWNHNNGLTFSNEGNMGSAVFEILGGSRGGVETVSSFTLSELCEISDVGNIDFIKCDVEGAESVIFEDENFLRNHQPRIILETHVMRGIETTDKCITDLEKFGYTCERIAQTGVVLPLLECYPPDN